MPAGSPRWEGFSLRWYQAALADPQLADGLLNSVIIALVAASLSTADRHPGRIWDVAPPRARCFPEALYLSLVTPEIVTGVSLLALFQWAFRFLHLRLGLAHRDRRPCCVLHRLCRHRGFCASAQL